MVGERQRRLLDCLAQRDEASIQDLCEALQVSPSTVRRELRSLEKGGLLLRTHGGAKVPALIHYMSLFEGRAAEQNAAKRIIAAAARELIAPGSVIGLMGGTTCAELARQLRSAEDLTIVTNAVNVAMELQHERISKRIMLTGGFMNRNSYELIGNLVASSLENIHLGVVFLGASGVDVQRGFSMSDEPEAAAGRAYMSVADRVVILADHTKIGKVTFTRFSPISEVNTLITDEGATPEQVDALRQAGLEVIVARSLIRMGNIAAFPSVTFQQNSSCLFPRGLVSPDV